MNEALFLYLHSLANRSPALDLVIVFLAEYLPWIIIAAAVAFLWIHIDKSSKEKIHEVWGAFFTSLVAYFSAIALKILFAEERPFIVLHDVAPLFIKNDYSFPSGHATFFFALSTAVFLRHKWAGAWFYLAAILISLARISAGAHFPADILGGIVLGAGIAYLLKKI